MRVEHKTELCGNDGNKCCTAPGPTPGPPQSKLLYLQGKEDYRGTRDAPIKISIK